MLGWRAINPAKSSRPSSSTAVGTAATTLADRGSPVTSDISPITSLRRSRAIRSPSLPVTRARPSTITNSVSPGSPARQMTSPGAKSRRRMHDATPSSASSGRPWNSGFRASADPATF
jgi:hypothetical protein